MAVPGALYDQASFTPSPACLCHLSSSGGGACSVPWTLVPQPALVQGPADSSTRKESPLLAPAGAVGGGSGPAAPPCHGMLTALRVFELRLIHQYLLGRVFGTEQVPGTPADRFFPVAFFVFWHRWRGLLAADKRQWKRSPYFSHEPFSLTTWHGVTLSVPHTVPSLTVAPHSSLAPPLRECVPVPRLSPPLSWTPLGSG